MPVKEIMERLKAVSASNVLLKGIVEDNSFKERLSDSQRCSLPDQHWGRYCRFSIWESVKSSNDHSFSVSAAKSASHFNWENEITIK